MHKKHQLVGNKKAKLSNKTRKFVNLNFWNLSSLSSNAAKVNKKAYEWSAFPLRSMMKIQKDTSNNLKFPHKWRKMTKITNHDCNRWMKKLHKKCKAINERKNHHQWAISKLIWSQNKRRNRIRVTKSNLHLGGVLNKKMWIDLTNKTHYWCEIRELIWIQNKMQWENGNEDRANYIWVAMNERMWVYLRKKTTIIDEQLES